MIASACRYFGQSPDYWEDALTMRRLDAQGRVLARDPPADWFLAIYFRANEWWTPPRDRGALPAAAPEINSTLPEFEP